MKRLLFALLLLAAPAPAQLIICTDIYVCGGLLIETRHLPMPPPPRWHPEYEIWRRSLRPGTTIVPLTPFITVHLHTTVIERGE